MNVKENKMSNKKKKNKTKGSQYLNINMDNGFIVDASMNMENIAYTIGHLLKILEENGHGPQEKMAAFIVDTNRKMAKK